jgi:thiol-disulfide isomerase/thioredoxin
LKNAQNIDWRDAAFAEQAGKLNKNVPVMVYCLGGGRSAAAAAKLEEMGFTLIYDMDGGYLAWTSANKPIVGADDSDSWKGMTKDEFLKQATNDKYVLVDFSAKWCRPCQEMMPMLEKVAVSKKDKLVLMQVDADANRSLLKDKSIDAIPYFELYKGGKLVWKHQGAIDEATLLKETGL